MTPLAMLIVRELTVPVKRRKGVDPSKLKSKMADAHCFDISNVKEAARNLGVQTFQQGEMSEIQNFLPAPKTWIEWRVDAGARFGCLLEEEVDGKVICWMAFSSNYYSFISHPDHFDLHLGWSRNKLKNLAWYGYKATDLGDRLAKLANVDGDDLVASASITLVGALALINSPKIIGRRQHMPHRGLERELLKQQKVIGKFPLHAWTEIVLDVTPPKDADGQHEYEAHLTGRRALHFVRAHLRIRDGKLQFVKSHWRGDAALGIKQSRYIIKGKAA